MIRHKNYWVEFLLGLGLGLGYLTTLRFFGPVGIPEILILMALALLIMRNPKLLLIFNLSKEGFFKAYILVANFIVLPLVTCVVYFFTDQSSGSTPQYVLSFAMGTVLMFYLADAIGGMKINMRVLVAIFSMAFIFTNLISIYFFGIEVGAAEDQRYTGGAKNPNQLIFYAATLSLLSVVYLKKTSFIVVAAVAFVVLKAKSDAYNLMIFVILSSYVFFVIFFKNNMGFKWKIFTSSFFVFFLLIFLLLNYSSEIGAIWLAADEGDARVLLMMNALRAVFYSPLLGFGAGSFSGVGGPFEGTEAHNTFLDFSVQFGLFYPIVLYGFIFIALIASLRRGEIMISSFIMGFVVSGLFHFSARHFVFWIEMAVFYSYVFNLKGK